MSGYGPAKAGRRILIVTDAWAPQVNGVVRTLQAVRAELVAMGHVVEVIAPDRFHTLPCPTYPEIRLAMPAPGAIARMIAAFGPDAIHLATEGPLCLAARRWCLRHDRPFTTAFHTNFPDYVERRTGLSADWFWPYFRWFHGAAQAVLTATPSVRAELHRAGIRHTHHWGRGVDLTQFSPLGDGHPALAGLPRPILLHVGRVAVEKNIEAFLALDTPGSKVVVGDGPARAALEARHPAVHFLGMLSGEALVSAYRAADVFVFPSRTDTFGLVMIEALACGTPVAAYPVTGPVDVLTAQTGTMDEDLARAVTQALELSPSACTAHARSFTWRRSAEQFLESLHWLGAPALAHAA
ncbi:glycosyltransferase involved in cell wall biosynthesis [Sphingobium sp. B2D3A]|uniref:glycosyltransferase family 4 protein n=1 Tax=unclassified Sphingobium TaxID=2611147 RepID=UPI0022241CA7|nr:MULTISPECIES: glycosyltransferase family 1 protein [unclassified Sphingobium]MCW2338957.1 glycosyltransferase involved in cell wall biosynthesis [Sphingobium sp. B2D3A]MCW2385382.1 glycosyltransferase involved in cell wall biosynthesis [Sphingobium sp. B2D3D]